MCIVLGGRRPVKISQTNIFARMVAPGVQALAYNMTIDADGETAMVLPLPVIPGTGDDAVSFVSLENHPEMFVEIAELFGPRDGDLGIVVLARSRGSAERTLEVHEVGSFVASYVPTPADFSRLDPRFRMPGVVFDAVPEYADYGFAVFQLRTGGGAKTIHPMALLFPTRDPDRLYFPTVHLHDGAFRAKAPFDHALFYQHPRCTQLEETFEGGAVSTYHAHFPYQGLVEQARPLVRRRLRGKLPNQDSWVAAI